MKKIAVVAAASVLALVGCSSESDSEQTTTAAEPTTSEKSDTEFASVGDTIPADCAIGQCIGEFKIEEILADEECKVIDDFLGAPPVPEGKKLIQISGIQENTTDLKDPTNGELLGMSLDFPQTWDNDDFRNSAEPFTGCVDPDGYEPWGTISEKGEKMRAYGAFLIPSDNELLGIGNSRFDLTKLRRLAPSSTSSTSAQDHASSEAPQPDQPNAEEPAAPAPVEAPAAEQAPPVEQAPAPAPVQEQAPEPVIGYTEAPGQVAPHQLDKTIASCGDSTMEIGTTFFTDGTSGWTQQCANQMM